jgi:Na+/proline symporter
MIIYGLGFALASPFILLLCLLMTKNTIKENRIAYAIAGFSFAFWAFGLVAFALYMAGYNV